MIEFDYIIAVAEKLANKNKVGFRYYINSNGHSLYVKYSTENAETCCRFSDHETLTQIRNVYIKKHTTTAEVRKALLKSICAVKKKSLFCALDKLNK